MRDTCAFYIRRSLVGQGLYAATLKQYVRTLVAKHCAPIEFFLEGTRSRSNKTLPPKYGEWFFEASFEFGAFDIALFLSFFLI